MAYSPISALGLGQVSRGSTPDNLSSMGAPPTQALIPFSPAHANVAAAAPHSAAAPSMAAPHAPAAPTGPRYYEEGPGAGSPPPGAGNSMMLNPAQQAAAQQWQQQYDPHNLWGPSGAYYRSAFG